MTCYPRYGGIKRDETVDRESKEAAIDKGHVPGDNGILVVR